MKNKTNALNTFKIIYTTLTLHIKNVSISNMNTTPINIIIFNQNFV